MGDLISRKFLQTAIHNFFYGLNHTPTEEDIQRYIEVAPSVENKGEWIPTIERLPEEGKNVLFCDNDDDIMLGYHLTHAPATHFVEKGSWEDIKNVRAWQPLPKPYKAVNK